MLSLSIYLHIANHYNYYFIEFNLYYMKLHLYMYTLMNKGPYPPSHWASENRISRFQVLILSESCPQVSIYHPSYWWYLPCEKVVKYCTFYQKISPLISARFLYRILQIRARHKIILYVCPTWAYLERITYSSLSHDNCWACFVMIPSEYEEISLLQYDQIICYMYF